MTDNEYVEHYGTLGMHWGRRKSTNAINTRVDSFKIDKGQTIHRAIVKKNDPTTGSVFATFKAKDAKRYAARNRMFSKNITFDTTMKTKETLISPSKKERVDTFVKLMTTDPKFAQTFNAHQQMYRPIKSKAKEAQLKTNIKDIEKEYGMFSVSLGGNKDLRDKYFSELKTKGYNMVIDDADAGLLADSPILIFDRQKSLEIVKVSDVTRAYVKALGKQK